MPRAANPVLVSDSLAPSPHNLFVGTSGWAYPTWKPEFYPQQVPARSFLAYYASQLTSVEVNFTFRKLPTAAQLSSWLAAVPPGFRFSFKAPQRITHFARLRECEAAVQELLAALAPAREKLGPVLFQLPPNFAADPERLSRFLNMPCLRTNDAPALAFEFRHASWFAEPVFALLRHANAALCVAESEDLRTPDVQTATYRYYRLRCPGGYAPARLKRLAATFNPLAETGEVFVYLKHEDQPTGALNAQALLKHANKLSVAAAGDR